MLKHFRTATGTGKPLTLDAKSAARLQAERDFGIYKRLSPAEQASLNDLRNKLAGESLDRQHITKNGGERGLAQKARATAMLQRQNEHGSK